MAGDFNNDWMPDLITSRDLLLNNGDGTFAAPLSHGANARPVPADINLDGLLDFVTPTAVFLGNGDGTFQEPLPHGRGGRVAIGDFDGDTLPDLVVLDGPGFSTRLGNGDGTFRPGQDVAVSGLGLIPATGDFNLDGFNDVVVSRYLEGDVLVFLNNGDGTFQTPQASLAFFPNSLMVTDLNLDSIPDVVTASFANSSITVLLGNGDGTFQERVRYGYNGDPLDAVITDVNLDYIPDVVAVDSYRGSIGVYLGNGDGTLRRQEHTDVGMQLDSVTAADFNGDGYADLATGSRAGIMSVFFNAADWSGGAPGTPPPGGELIAALLAASRKWGGHI